MSWWDRFSDEALRRRQPEAVYLRRRLIAAGGLVGGIAVIGWPTFSLLPLGDATPVGSDDEAGAALPDASSGDGNATQDPYHQAGWIGAENAKPGADDWGVPEDPEVWARIRGYAGVTSLNREGPVELYVSTAAPRWSIEAFRIGFYGGKGARLVWEQADLDGIEQPEETMDAATRMVEANWSSTFTVDVTREWPPGCYVFRLQSDDGGASYLPLTIRDDDSPAALLVQNSVTTWQAYNDWGGASLYYGAPGNDPDLRANVVSFDRPYGGNGSGEFFGRERELIHLVEQLGMDVTYWTDIDLHEQPERVRQHKALVSLGHDEYYSTVMRQGLEDARDAGVNLAILGANAAYRRIRLEESPLGANRREVNYRDAALDPMSGVDDDNVTTSFREPPNANPESSLIGNFYECNPVEADMVIVDADAWMFEGTGVRNGDTFPGVVGNEYDRVNTDWPTPESIQVVAHSPVTCKGEASFADMTYYTADSGAGVFATGTLWWIREHLLIDCRDEWDDPQTWQCKVQRITANVLQAFAEGPAGERHPSRNNLAAIGIEDKTSVNA